MKIISYLFLALSFLNFGCASKGFNRGELLSQAGVSKPQYDDNEIKEAFSKKANLPKPFKLAVYFKAPPQKTGLNPEWRWSEKDKALFESIAADMKSQGLTSEVFPILGTLVTDEDIKSLRLVAAKHHADALLVIGGSTQIDRYINNWGWTYALLLPTLFVPGSQADTLFVTNATLWDVRNEYLYLSVESEATTNNTYIAAFGKQDKELVEQAKMTALSNLKGELQKMVQGKKF